MDLAEKVGITKVNCLDFVNFAKENGVLDDEIVDLDEF